VVAPKSASRGLKQVSSVLTGVSNTRRDQNKKIMLCHQKNYYRQFMMRSANLWIGVNIVIQSIARENIRNGAEVLRMFAVYEEKLKDDKLVRKVRLV
jgi:hypothetical protein